MTDSTSLYYKGNIKKITLSSQRRPVIRKLIYVNRPIPQKIYTPIPLPIFPVVEMKVPDIDPTTVEFYQAQPSHRLLRNSPRHRPNGNVEQEYVEQEYVEQTFCNVS